MSEPQADSPSQAQHHDVNSAGGPPVAGRPPRRMWDLLVTIALLVVLIPFDLAVSYAGAFLTMASDSCTTATCNTAQIDLGVLLAFAGPSVLLLIGIIVAIILLVRRRLAFWVPLATGVAMLAIWAVGAAVTFGSQR